MQSSSMLLLEEVSKQIIFTFVNMSSVITHSQIKLIVVVFNYSITTTGLYECLLFNTGSIMLRGESLSSEEGVEALRVAQVATILSNLSGENSSAQILAGSTGVLR